MKLLLTTVLVLGICTATQGQCTNTGCTEGTVVHTISPVLLFPRIRARETRSVAVTRTVTRTRASVARRSPLGVLRVLRTPSRPTCVRRASRASKGGCG